MTAWLLASVLAAAPPPRLAATVTIDRPTQGPVITVAGDVIVRARVAGDVVALAGNVVLAPDGAVDGDVVAVGGRVTGAGTATGRVIGIASLDVPLPPISARGGVRVWLGLVAVRLGLWLCAAGLLLLLSPRLVRLTAERISGGPWRSAAVGALALVVWLVLVALAVAAAASVGGALVLLAGVSLLLLVKAVGVTAVAWLVGGAAARWWPVALRGEVPRTVVALAVLLLLSLLPVVGSLAWVGINAAAIGGVVGVLLAGLPTPQAVSRLAR